MKEPSDWAGEERCRAPADSSKGLWAWANTTALVQAVPYGIRRPRWTQYSRRNTTDATVKKKQLDATCDSIFEPACPSNSTPELLLRFREVLRALLTATMAWSSHNSPLDHSNSSSKTIRLASTELATPTTLPPLGLPWTTSMQALLVK